MQGSGSSVSTLPENINFDCGSASSDVGTESQMSCNNMQTSIQNCLPEYRISSRETNIQYHQHVRPVLNVEWSLGAASFTSSQHQSDQNEKEEQTLTFRPQATLVLEEGKYGQSSILSLDNNNQNPNGSQTTNGSFVLRSSSSIALPQDLNMISEFDDQEDDDECQLVERPTPYVSIGPSNEQRLSTSSSSDSFVMDEKEDRPGCSLDGRRMSCKRKALEGHTVHSSGVGSSSCFQNDEMTQYHAMSSAHVVASNTSIKMPTENEFVANNSSEQENPRLRLGIGGSVSASPFSLGSSGNVESSQRSFRFRINGLYQQDPIPNSPFSTETVVENVDASSSQLSTRLIHNNLLDLNPAPQVENGSLHGQLIPYVSSVHQHHQSRWSGASSTRSSRSSASALFDDRNSMPFGEPTSRNIPRSISEHPMFFRASEMGSLSQNSTNWNMPGGSNRTVENGGPISRVGPSTEPNSSAPSWPHWNHAQYPRRPPEIMRRSLLSSIGVESRGESSNHGVRSNSWALPQEMVPFSGSESHGHRLRSSRSALLDRHLEGAFGVSYSLRTLAAAGEGRGNIMSEICHVLDLMRRGEGLRVEDVMILDRSVLFGMANIHDRHRDMRLDVDNMSYEELLALEERIGNVCTGLSEENITSRLKQKKYIDNSAVGSMETVPCAICREEYNVGEDLGTLVCGHDFHIDCIKQWLAEKNLCPICKTTGLTT